MSARLPMEVGNARVLVYAPAAGVLLGVTGAVLMLVFLVLDSTAGLAWSELLTNAFLYGCLSVVGFVCATSRIEETGGCSALSSTSRSVIRSRRTRTILGRAGSTRPSRSTR